MKHLRVTHSFELILAAGLVSLTTVVSVTAAEEKPGRRPPNIIVILADDLGAECLSCYGSTSYKTPNLDALAESGVRFLNCHATPLCSPSRVELMTGRYGFRTGWTNMIERGEGAVNEFFDPGKERTFGHVLKNAGYATALAGKWQLAQFQNHPRHVNECGFDEYCCWTWLYDGKRTDRYWKPSVWQDGELRKGVGDKYGEDIFCDFLIDFIERNQAKPFFVYYPMVLVHDPFEPTPDEKQAGLKGNKGANVSHFPAMVAYMDKTVGRLIAKLDELKLRENTLILFTGDNGTPRPVTSRAGDTVIPGGKGTVTYFGSHVPLIASWKGTVPAGRVLDDLVDFTDVLPTVAEVANAALPRGVKLDGHSFAPQLRGQTGRPREWVYVRLGDASFARDQRWLLHNDGRLYDLKNDLFERHDLSGDARHAAEIRRLTKALVAQSDEIRKPSNVRCIEPNSASGTSRAVVVNDVPLAHTTQLLPWNVHGKITGNAEQQIRQVVRNLSLALKPAQTTLAKVVKVNVYLKQPELRSTVEQVFARTFAGPSKPAVSFVVGNLTYPDALVAVDAVASVPAKSAAREVKRFRSSGFQPGSGSHVAVLPSGGEVYVSGQAEKGELAEATRKTLESLVATLDHLSLKRSQIVQIKSFMQPMSDVGVAQKEIERFFGNELCPPTVFVEWIGGGATPIEIELIASAPEDKSGESLSFITPPGMKPSPVYSKVVRVNHGKTVFVSSLYANESTDAAGQVQEIFGSLRRLLKAAGSDFDHLAKATYYVSDNEASTKLNEIRPEFYNPQRPPAASKAMVHGVGWPGKSVTWDMIAVAE